MAIFYIFIDGIGIGKKEPETNPFARFGKSLLRSACCQEEDAFPEGLYRIPTDASLGVLGLPQSATGQTALWTGCNGPQIQGHHLTGRPGPTLARVIHSHSILKVFEEHGCKGDFLNAYSEEFLEKMALNPRLASASTHVQLATGRPPHTFHDLKEGNAIFMDITHEVLGQIFPGRAEQFPVIPAKQRGNDLVHMSQKNDISLFEFFLTDKAGHDQDWAMARWCIRTLEEFLDGILEAMNPRKDLLIVTSDHGNLEELNHHSHTLNPVPTLVYGMNAELFRDTVRDLTDIPRVIYETMDWNDINVCEG